jgi:hypothetical protein
LSSALGHANRCFKFHERGQLFIGVRNEMLSVATMRVRNEHFSSVRMASATTASVVLNEIVRNNDCTGAQRCREAAAWVPC